MIGIDTNVLVRILVEDDPDQCARASALLRGALARGEPIFVSHLVVCETVWVLASCYDFDRQEIASTMDDLLRALGITVQNRDQVVRALAHYRLGKGDLADFLIREQSVAAGCDQVATFDKALLTQLGFFVP